MTVSQTDIARHLGITQKTVSRVFTTPKQVSAELRLKVLTAARQLGYRPNSGTRSLRTGNFSSVVLVGSTVTEISPLPEFMMMGLEEVLTPAGVSLSFVRLSEDEQLKEFIPKAVRELITDGLLVNYHTNIPQLLVDLIEEQRLPAVWINSRHDTDCVRPDDVQAGDDLTRCLIKHGHQRILYTDFSLEQSQFFHYSNKDRLTGYRTAMTRAGLTQHEAIPDHGIEPAAYAAAMLERHRPTALITYGGFEASTFIIAAMRRGWEIPRDLSLATFSPSPVYLGLSIATWLVPQLEMGRVAARQLLNAVRGGTAPAPAIALPFAHHLGASLASPAVR